jgi:hypothetical protein
MQRSQVIALGFCPKITQPAAVLGDHFPADEICSVSNCFSRPSDDWVDYWLHNELGFYDSEWAAMQIVRDDPADYDFYAYKLAQLRWDQAGRERIAFRVTADASPPDYEFLGYDIVSRSVTAYFEHSALWCNLAADGE